MIFRIGKNIGGFILLCFNPRADSIEILYRKRLFTIYMLLFSVPLLILGPIHINTALDDKNTVLFYEGIINVVLSIIFLALVISLRRADNGRLIYRTTLIILEIILANWLVMGPGISFYPSIFVLTFPPFAFFLMGKREGMFWTAVLSIMTIIVFADPGPLNITVPYPRDYVLRHLIAFSLIVLFTYNYESIRERFKNAMESEQAKLQLEKERLVTEVDTRRRVEESLRQHQDHLEDLVAERTREISAGERRYRLLADNVNDLIWAMDLDMKFTFISPSVAAMYGYSIEEAKALPLEKWMTPDSLELFLKECRKLLEREHNGTADPNRYAVIELEELKKDGTLLDVELKISFIRDSAGKAIGMVGISRDITERIHFLREREKTNEQLAQAQKLDALGTLVSGLAHDFNNILTGIMGSFDFLNMFLKKQKLEGREKIEKYLDIGMDSSRRSAELVRQLLSLSKKHAITLAPVDVNEAIRYIHTLCRNSLPKSVELDFDLSGGPFVVMADLVQIEQVLLNLCINASHSMTLMRPAGSRQGGVLTLRAGTIENDAGLKALSPAQTGSGKAWVRIQVSDTGTGMDEETRLRIFEPFFSLKQKNEGTGLGLSISYNIIEKHGGFITVYSEPGKGSVFSVYLPSHRGGEGLLQKPDRDDAIVRGSGTVLVIDDEALVLETAKGLLEECGYDVLTALGAERGTALYRERHGSIAVVLIDLSMPDRSGLDVFRELKKIDSGVRAILSSGMMDEESMEAALAEGIKDMIHKPYMTRELSDKIRAVIS